MAFRFEQKIAFICPVCSKISEESLNIFDFSGMREVSISCSDEKCDADALRIKQAGDKYKIYVECPLCLQTHIFSISTKALWAQDLISFGCPRLDDADILFIGKKKSVDAVKRKHDIKEYNS